MDNRYMSDRHASRWGIQGHGNENRSKYRAVRVENTLCSDFTEKFPIAMAYVPWQKWGTVYQTKTALERGTIFPELDLPFLGEEVR